MGKLPKRASVLNASGRGTVLPRRAGARGVTGRILGDALAGRPTPRPALLLPPGCGAASDGVVERRLAPWSALVERVGWAEAKRALYAAMDDEGAPRGAPLPGPEPLARGPDAVLLDDPHAVLLAPEEFARLVAPATRAAVASLREGAPVIYATQGTALLLPHLPGLGADAWGVDWRVPLEDVRAKHPRVPLVGNLDPTLLLAPEAWLRQEARWMLDAMPGPGYVAALGGPLAPGTPRAALEAFADEVRSAQRA